MTVADTTLLVCPVCRGDLVFAGRRRGEAIASGTLGCGACARDWPVRDGLPELLDDGAIAGVEWLMRLIYDNLAPLHDPLARWLMPLLQSSSEAAARDGYMHRLELDRLAPHPDGRPLRILEVGVGTGANFPLVERDLPAGLSVELWGCDFSRGMLAQCRRRLDVHGGRPLRLLLADAHALPFRDGSFDRVFHVGGIAAYRDPRLGLAEMARVARPGTPIVVVDEQLDPRRAHGLYHRLAFRALTFYDPSPASPVALLPAGATDVIDEQVTRFYYCLTFRAPGNVRRGAPSGGPATLP